jgi:hypothetical protein
MLRVYVSIHSGKNSGDFGALLLDEQKKSFKNVCSTISWEHIFAPHLKCKQAGVAQLVEHHLAKVNVASSSLVSRSMTQVIISSLCCMPCYHFPPMAGHFFRLFFCLIEILLSATNQLSLIVLNKTHFIGYYIMEFSFPFLCYVQVKWYIARLNAVSFL